MARCEGGGDDGVLTRSQSEPPGHFSSVEAGPRSCRALRVFEELLSKLLTDKSFVLYVVDNKSYRMTWQVKGHFLGILKELITD